MKIDILAFEGSSFGVTSKSLWGDEWRIGCGGSEYALITMCEEWTKAGHEVILYNNPYEYGVSPFDQRHVEQFNPKDNRDVLITFRSPNPKSIISNGLKVWWSCDQGTVGDYKAFAPYMDKIVGISPFHQVHFAKAYGVHNSIYIDIPVRVDDFKDTQIYRIPERLLFSSVPARGIDNLWRMWPTILRQCPSASLVITSDYRLWGSAPSDGDFRKKWSTHERVEYLGALPRQRLIEEQLCSFALMYPSNYDELFCVSVAEAQVAGCYPVTSGTGALPTTNMGIAIAVDANNPQNDKTFVDAIVSLLHNPNVETMRQEVQAKAIQRFRPSTILAEWDSKVFSL